MNVENYLYGLSRLNFKKNNQTFKRENLFALKIEEIIYGGMVFKSLGGIFFFRNRLD